jgi:hypothetical protein
MKYEPKYNRLNILDMYDEDWIIDRSGNLVMREDIYNNREEGIPMQTIEIDERI